MQPFAKQSAKPVSYFLYTIVALAILLAAIFWAGNNPTFIEKYYSGYFYRFTSIVLHYGLGWLPFSVGDLLYTTIISLVIYSIIKLFKLAVRKCYKLMAILTLKFIIGLQLFVLGFYLLWGLNYSRPPAAKILNLTDSTYTLTQLQATTLLLIDSANTLRATLLPAQLQASSGSVYRAAIAAIKTTGALYSQLRSVAPAVKPALFTPVVNYFGTAGYFNPFTGEAQINYAMPMVNKPVSACHEMAHQMGFAREDEANFIAFLAGIRSKDKLLRYSAYYLAMQEFMQQLHRKDSLTFKQFKLQIAPDVRSDIKADRAYWLHYSNQISEISGIFYDQFLKANKQPEGMRTYNRMIILTMAYYKQQSNKLPYPSE